jgi:hypothetical protein
VLILANLLLIVSGLLVLLLTFSMRRSGPEGPVGAHMITAPLALGQALALAIAFGHGNLAPLGLPNALLYGSLLGHFVALTIVPILALDSSSRWFARVAMSVAVGGALLVVDGELLAPGSRAVLWVGTVGIATASVTGYGMLLALFVKHQKNQFAQARADAERQETFQTEQAAWQLGEWNKLPADAALWQRITFTHAFHPDVKAQCHERLANDPDLEQHMIELLGTGWATHAMAYLRDFYPRSRAPLAMALSTFFDSECESWRTCLDDASMPESYFYNLLSIVEVAEKTADDGGNVRDSMQRWAKMLAGRRGLEPLATRCAQIANATS